MEFVWINRINPCCPIFRRKPLIQTWWISHSQREARCLQASSTCLPVHWTIFEYWQQTVEPTSEHVPIITSTLQTQSSIFKWWILTAYQPAPQTLLTRHGQCTSTETQKVLSAVWALWCFSQSDNYSFVSFFSTDENQQTSDQGSLLGCLSSALENAQLAC